MSSANYAEIPTPNVTSAPTSALSRKRNVLIAAIGLFFVFGGMGVAYIRETGQFSNPTGMRSFYSRSVFDVSRPPAAAAPNMPLIEGYGMTKLRSMYSTMAAQMQGAPIWSTQTPPQTVHRSSIPYINDCATTPDGICSGPFTSPDQMIVRQCSKKSGLTATKCECTGSGAKLEFAELRGPRCYCQFDLENTDQASWTMKLYCAPQL